MSTPTADYSNLLRESVRQAKANAPRAVDDLLRCASESAKAVEEVTRGAAALELVPINQENGAAPAYQLLLRRVGSEAPPSDLGVYSVTAAGYPVQRWYSRNAWDSHPDRPNGQYSGIGELEGRFKWMVSHPESRLVVLVTFFQDQTPSSTSATAGPAPN
ncbi:MAG TPA: hypothetical protein VNH11_18790 [Pirellulales bacterium]|nr:hypothetical protein [Pirellulales bacterium]